MPVPGPWREPNAAVLDPGLARPPSSRVALQTATGQERLYLRPY